MADPQMRSLSVAAIFVVGYVLSAVAQNSTPKLNNPATQVAPNPESSLSEELDKAAMRVLKELQIPDPRPPMSLDNPALQTLKSLAPVTTQQKTR
jgi:hypothetical protein